jgi:glycosyltransferase involved in cell wall biosynthesis
MATIDDFDGVYFTVTSLMIHHAEAMRDCELVVVDNNPTSRHGRLVERWIRDSVPNGRHHPFPSPTGTAQARNEVFRCARGEIVLCLDCHVLLVPGALQKLIDFHVANPQCRDLLLGPLIRDSGQVAATHQRPEWSAGAWGVWSFDERLEDGDEPFEIWQQGMGLFSCRRDAWVGFHHGFRGFGGCETYIMEKVRRSGARVLCCPWLGWTHRFHRPNGVPYRVDHEDRLRNYVIGFDELGLSVEPLLKHFHVSHEDLSRLRETTDIGAPARDIAIVGYPRYGGVKMRGLPLAKHLDCDFVAAGQVRGMDRRNTVIAIKSGFCPNTLRQKCDRLIYDPLDCFFASRASDDPIEYWRSIYRQMKFDDIIATSPACCDVMREALDGKAQVHMVPHPSDSRIDATWRDPAGPVAYAGLDVFIASGFDRIRQACLAVGKDFVTGQNCDVLKGASLALSLRLAPYDTPLNRRCKPQIKLENAAAAGLPTVSTDCPAAISLHPDARFVSSTCSSSELVAALKMAFHGPGLSRPFTIDDYLASMRRLLHRTSVVVYTAIFGGYDELRDPRERIPGVRYVCFTDNPWLKSNVWDVRYCRPTGDPLLQAKRYKILCHEAVNCDVSLWIDARIELYGLRNALQGLTADIALLPHPRRNCIYAEASHCKTVRRGDPSRIDAAIARYRAEGHPEGYGLWLGGLILRRHTTSTIAFNREWWREVSMGTSRDQIVLPVVLRRLGIPFETLSHDVLPCHIRDHLK